MKNEVLLRCLAFDCPRRIIEYACGNRNSSASNNFIFDQPGMHGKLCLS